MEHSSFALQPPMARKVLQKYLPHFHRVREHQTLRMFGSAALKDNLWHLNRRSVARAFAIGIFCALLPLPGQMVVAAALAILFAANLPLAVLLVWITNPFTIPPIFLTSYLVGSWVLGIPPQHFAFEWSWAWFTEELYIVGLPLLVGSLICGTIGAAASYWGILLYWRWYVVRIWQTRHKRRVEKVLHDILEK